MTRHPRTCWWAISTPSGDWTWVSHNRISTSEAAHRAVDGRGYVTLATERQARAVARRIARRALRGER